MTTQHEMVRLVARPLDAQAFAPYGTVTDAPAPGSRGAIGPAVNLRPHAQTQLEWVVAQAQTLPMAATVLERHRHSSQSFIPCDADARWLVLVAPHGAGGAPCLDRALAFVASGHQALTYAADVWHHPLCALDRPARFALLTHRDGGPQDDIFAQLPAALEIVTQG